MWADILEQSRTNEGWFETKTACKSPRLDELCGGGDDTPQPMKLWSDSDHGSDNKLNSNRITEMPIHMLQVLTLSI